MNGRLNLEIMHHLQLVPIVKKLIALEVPAGVGFGWVSSSCFPSGPFFRVLARP